MTRKTVCGLKNLVGTNHTNENAALRNNEQQIMRLRDGESCALLKIANESAAIWKSTPKI